MSDNTKPERPNLNIVKPQTTMPQPEAERVNVDNYVRAETAIQFKRIVKMAKGLGRLSHGRMPVPINKQHIARMNRDTLYSSGLVNISEGATLTIPESGDRYFSVAIINEDNYTTAIFHDASDYLLTQADHDTMYVAVIVRVLVDPTKDQDLLLAHQLQDQVSLLSHQLSHQLPHQTSNETEYSIPNFDRESHKTTHQLLQQLGAGLKDAAYCNGKKHEIRETRHLLCTAFGWGGLPTYEVTYINSSMARPVGKYQLTLKKVPVDGFWSISIYNADGFFEENEYVSYSTNSVVAKSDSKGACTINFGPVDEGQDNFLYVMNGWSYVVRFYQPRAELLNGEWQMPSPEPLGKL